MAPKKIRQSPQLPAEKRRAQLLKAAHKLFLKKGYKSTTTEEIAREVGVTKGSVYFHFKSKEEILAQLVLREKDRDPRDIVDAIHQNVTPGEFLGLLVAAEHHGSAREYTDMVDIWVQAMRIPRVRRQAAKEIRQLLDLYAERSDPSYAASRQEALNLGILAFAVHCGLAIYKHHVAPNIDFAAQVQLFDSLVEARRGAHLNEKPVNLE